jgi:two-component system, cell cycle sensor histidine kinase and response regulator CckA
LKKETRNQQDSALRRQAEKHLEVTGHSGMLPEDMVDVVHDLQVHQIELKMQNEELRRIQAELEKERDRYSDLYDFSPVGYFTVSENGIIEEANLFGAAMTGIDRRALIGMPFSHLVFRDDQDIFYKHRKALFETETSQACELRLMKRNGDEFFAGLECMVLKNVEGAFRKIRVVISDITGRKLLEEELFKAKNLESMGILAGGIAHDFNNILTAIIGNISMAKTQQKVKDEIYDLLDDAEAASLRAQVLTRQLLTFAKGGAPIKEISSIKDILTEASLFALHGLKSVCEFSIAEDLLTSEIDVVQFSQAINNIIINSNQAMPEGGVIQISANNFVIAEDRGLPVKPGRYIRISIKDHGIGIPEKHLSKIFDPYFTTKNKGSGLGLAVAYSIIRKHNGHITVESSPGAGTTFHIYLPASGKAIPKKAEVKPITGHGMILVMDDEKMLWDVLRKMLGKLGYEAEFAKDGSDAVEMYKTAVESEKPFDAVIMDLTIPDGMGGKDAVKRLLEIDPEAKAVVSSGYSNDPVMANFQAYGFKGILPKPFKSIELGRVLHEVLKDGKKDHHLIS